MDDDPRPLAAEVGMRKVIRRSYVIESWRTWDHELNAFAQDFKGKFGLYPNIMLASQTTLARIDMAAKKTFLRNDVGEIPSDGEYTPVSSFSGTGYDLMFAIDEKLADRNVSLIHDSHPDGGGDPVPDEDTPGAEAPTTWTAAKTRANG